MKVAIDGPAASGKSTVAKLLASELGYLYIDTGAMYRSIAYAYWSEHGLVESVEEALAANLLADFKLELKENSKIVILNGKDISSKIRQNEVSKMASKVAALPVVREKLVELQRQIAEGQNVILDGRDVGTVVFPQAELKIYMEASAEVRAQRRYDELKAKGEEVELKTLIAEIEERDHRDKTRDHSPLIKADDAIEINTDNLTVDEVCQRVKTHLSQ